VKQARIQLGSTTGIGTIDLDLDQTRGEGGPENPYLVLGLNIALNPRRADQMLALASLSCSLYLSPPGPEVSSTQIKLVGQPVAIDLTNGKEQFIIRSISKFPAQVQARIPLTGANVAQIERHRHEHGAFTAVGRFSADVVWFVEIGNSQHLGGPETPPLENPFSTEFGILSTLAHFWTASVEDLDISIPASVWVDKILPGLGLNRLRLVEVMLPEEAGSLSEQIINYFDTARRSFDLGHYRPSMLQLRDMRHATEAALGAVKGRRVADIIAERLALPTDSEKRRSLDSAWEALVHSTNMAAHLTEGPYVTPADARACLLMAAVVIEYVNQLLWTPASR
jgi:hypothetical protein